MKHPEAEIVFNAFSSLHLALILRKLSSFKTSDGGRNDGSGERRPEKTFGEECLRNLSSEIKLISLISEIAFPVDEVEARVGFVCHCRMLGRIEPTEPNDLL